MMKIYAARLDRNNVVVETIVLPPAAGTTDAEIEEYCTTDLGKPGNWIRTFKDRAQRRHFAGEGYTYDAVKDAFIPPLDPKYRLHVLDEDTLRWQPPTDPPDDDDFMWVWDPDLDKWRVQRDYIKDTRDGQIKLVEDVPVESRPQRSEPPPSDGRVRIVRSSR